MEDYFLDGVMPLVTFLKSMCKIVGSEDWCAYGFSGKAGYCLLARTIPGVMHLARIEMKNQVIPKEYFQVSG